LDITKSIDVQPIEKMEKMKGSLNWQSDYIDLGLSHDHMQFIARKILKTRQCEWLKIWKIGILFMLCLVCDCKDSHSWPCNTSLHGVFCKVEHRWFKAKQLLWSNLGCIEKLLEHKNIFQ
jgi:hypothetical protein